MNVVDCCGLQAASYGDFARTDTEAIVIDSPQNFVYRKLLFSEGKIVGATFTGRANDLGHAAHFTKIVYAPLPKEAADALIAAAEPANAAFLKGKDLFRLELAADTGQAFTMVVIDPAKDPFWVVTLAEGKLARSFFVASLDHLNQKR